MLKYLRWCLSLTCILLLFLPALADDNEEGGATLDPGLQWKIAESTWNRREYDDAAVLYVAFGQKNPDDDNGLESWWRACLVYHNYRSNPKRYKETYPKAIDACERWIAKYATSKPDRAAHGYWYKATLLNNDGNRAMALETLLTQVKKFPDINWNGEPYWTIGEWLREAKRLPEAIKFYDTYANIVGTSQEYGAAAIFRIGWCNESLANRAEAIAAYQRILHAKFNWGWGQVHWNALDAARRLKKMGEKDLALEFLKRIVEKCDSNADVTKQAMAELGAKPAMKIWIHPHLYYHYYSTNMSIDSRSKVTLKQEVNLLVRPTYIIKDAPFNAMVTLAPKVEMLKVPTTMKLSADAKAYEAKLFTDKGGDFWYSFWRADQSVPLPDGLVITRKWEKMGATWGECQIRVQSNARWHVYIYMPDNKTNPNNMNIQPSEVRDNGRTFLWYDWAIDPSQGVTFKFPVDVGGNASAFYPKMRLEHWAGPGYAEQSGNNSEATYDMRECKVSVKADAPFPYTINCPAYSEVTMEEVVK